MHLVNPNFIQILLLHLSAQYHLHLMCIIINNIIHIYYYLLHIYIMYSIINNNYTRLFLSSLFIYYYSFYMMQF